MEKSAKRPRNRRRKDELGVHFVFYPLVLLCLFLSLGFLSLSRQTQTQQTQKFEFPSSSFPTTTFPIQIQSNSIQFPIKELYNNVCFVVVCFALIIIMRCYIFVAVFTYRGLLLGFGVCCCCYYYSLVWGGMLRSLLDGMGELREEMEGENERWREGGIRSLDGCLECNGSRRWSLVDDDAPIMARNSMLFLCGN